MPTSLQDAYDRTARATRDRHPEGSLGARISEIDRSDDVQGEKVAAAGVETTGKLPELAGDARNLATTFEEVVAARPGILRRIPSEETVAGWVDQAKGLDKIVTH